MLHRTLLGAALLGLVGLPYVLSTQKEQPRAPEAGLETPALSGTPARPIESPPGLAVVPPVNVPAAHAISAGSPPEPAVRPAAAPATPANLEDPDDLPMQKNDRIAGLSQSHDLECIV